MSKSMIRGNGRSLAVAICYDAKEKERHCQIEEVQLGKCFIRRDFRRRSES